MTEVLKFNIGKIRKEVSAEGWENIPVGYYRSSGQIKPITGFELFIRNVGRFSSLFVITKPSMAILAYVQFFPRYYTISSVLIILP